EATCDREGATLDPAELRQSCAKGGDPLILVCGRSRAQESDGWNLRGLLPARRDRASRSTAEKRDELAPFHSITSSARASKIGERSKPSALAALRLITNSNLVPCWTGKSAGFAPLRILSTKVADRYHISFRLAQ